MTNPSMMRVPHYPDALVKFDAHRRRVDEHIARLQTAAQIGLDFPRWARKIAFADEGGYLSTDNQWWWWTRCNLPGYAELLQERLGPLLKVSVVEDRIVGFTRKCILVQW